MIGKSDVPWQEYSLPITAQGYVYTFGKFF